MAAIKGCTEFKMTFAMRFVLIVSVLAILAVDVESEETVGFATPLSILLSTRNTIVKRMKAMGNHVDNPNLLKNYVQDLKDLQEHTKAFIEAPLTRPESRSTLKMLKGVIAHDRTFSDEEVLYQSYSLKKDKNGRLGMLWNRMTINIQQFLSSGKQTHVMPLSNVCKGLPLSSLSSLSKNSVKDITISDICRGLYQCAKEARPYYHSKFDGGTQTGVRKGLPWFGPDPPPPSSNTGGLRLPFFTDAPTTPTTKPTPDPRLEQNAQTACMPNQQCNVEKALPMMTGILWYKISEMIIQRVCSEGCAGESHDYAKLYQEVIEETDMLILYATSLPSFWSSVWTPFFKSAVANDAFVKLDEALKSVKSKEDDFQTAEKLCSKFQFAKACPLSDLYSQYILIKQVQQRRTQTMTLKDLRLLAQVDHSKMLELVTDGLQQLQLLGSIKKLDDNLESSVAGISNYFKELAKYDQGIAAADVTFIDTELTKYETALTNVESEITKDLKEAMKLMKIVLAANLAEQIAILAVVLLANSNPLKLIFSGPDLKDTMEQGGKVADASAKLKYGLALIDALNDLTQDSLKLRQAFIGNKNQLTSLKTVVDKIRNGKSNDIGKDANDFIKDYGDYTPKTDKSRLERNNALWQSFKEATCSLLNGEVGVGGAVPQAIAGGKLLCEHLDGALAQFFTLRDDIFEFQFQMVDAIASVVRGNIAQRLATNIQGKHETLHASLLMTGFFMAQNKIQTTSSVYCDRLEYQNLGEPITACSTHDGLFRNENIQSLITYKDTKAYEIIDRDVYIPTKGSYSQTDINFVDLQALARNETVFFKVPSDIKWLQDHHWILPGEDTIPFVVSFKLFLPQRQYKSGAAQEYTTTKVTVSSVAGSATSATPGGVVYLLPRNQTVYRTLYEVGYRTCRSEMKNPYSLCNNLPKLCDVVQRVPGSSLLPTVISVWGIKQAVFQGSNRLAWDVPSSATNILLHAKVKLKVPARIKRFLTPSTGLSRSDITYSSDGCCKVGNRYRISVYNYKCAECPTKTTSFLGGLYCQID